MDTKRCPNLLRGCSWLTMIQYSETCVALISAPLDYALPASFTAFLEQMIGCAAGDLSVATIKPLHSILSTLGARYLECLPFEILTELQDEMQTLVRRLSLEEHLDLLCLAILAKLSSVPPLLEERRSILKDQSLRPAQAFFTDKHAKKTLNLIILITISICSSNSTLMLESALESLQLVEEIADAIEPVERQSWLDKNSGKMRKLCEKIRRPGIDLELQCAALNAVATLIGDQPIPAGLTHAFEAQLLMPGAAQLSPKALSKFLRQVESCTVTRKVTAVIRIAHNNENPSRLPLNEIDKASSLVDALIRIVEESSSLCDAILPSAPSEDFLAQVDHITAYTPSECRLPTVHDSQVTCPYQASEGLNSLREQINSLLLKCALLSQQRPKTEYLPSFRRLLKFRSKPVRSTPPCGPTSEPTNHSKNRLSLIETDGTPEKNSASQDWKHTLIKQLSRDAIFRYESIVRTVGDVCRDFETRCNDVELPLREEQEKSSKLQNQLGVCQSVVQELREEVRDCTAINEESKAENGRLRKQLNTNEGTLQNLSARLERTQEEFVQAKTEARRIANAAAESSRERDLAYMATLKSRDELYENQTSELDSVRALLVALEKDKKEATAQATELLQQNKDMVSTVGELRKKAADGEATLKMVRLELESLQRSQQRLLVEKDEADSMTKEAANLKESAIESLQSNLQSAKSETRDLQLRFEDFVKATEAEHDNLKSSHDASMTRLREEARKASKVEGERNLIITELQRTNSRLRQDRDRIEKEYAEAQEFRRRLMAVVEVQNPISFPATRNVKHDHHHHSGETGFIVADKAVKSTSAQGASFGSDSSSHSGGPSPKRNKIHKSPLARRARASIHVTKSKTPAPPSSQSSRQPLSDVLSAQNRRFTTTGVFCRKMETLAPIDPSSEILESASLDERLQLDESFSGDENLTCTEQRQLSTLKNMTLRPTYDDDETTTDV